MAGAAMNPWDGVTLLSPMLKTELESADTLARSLRDSAAALPRQWDAPSPKTPARAEPTLRLDAELHDLRVDPGMKALLESNEQATEEMLRQHRLDMEQMLAVGASPEGSGRTRSSPGERTSSPRRLTPSAADKLAAEASARESALLARAQLELEGAALAERTAGRRAASISPGELRVDTPPGSLGRAEPLSPAPSSAAPSETPAAGGRDAEAQELSARSAASQELQVSELEEQRESLAGELAEAQSAREEAATVASHLEAEMRQALTCLQTAREDGGTARGASGASEEPERPSALEISYSDVVEAATLQSRREAVAQFEARQLQRERRRALRTALTEWSHECKRSRQRAMQAAQREVDEAQHAVEDSAIAEITALQEQAQRSSAKILALQEHETKMKEHIALKDAEVSRMMTMNEQTMELLREAVSVRDHSSAELGAEREARAQEKDAWEAERRTATADRERLELLESQRAEQTARGELAASEWATERQGLEGKHRLALIGLESKDRECADLRKTVERLTTSVSEAQARAAESDDRARSAESRMWTELSARNEEISGLITANTQSELAMVTEMSELRQAVEARTVGEALQARRNSTDLTAESDREAELRRLLEASAAREVALREATEENRVLTDTLARRAQQWGAEKEQMASQHKALEMLAERATTAPAQRTEADIEVAALRREAALMTEQMAALQQAHTLSKAALADSKLESERAANSAAKAEQLQEKTKVWRASILASVEEKDAEIEKLRQANLKLASPRAFAEGVRGEEGVREAGLLKEIKAKDAEIGSLRRKVEATERSLVEAQAEPSAGVHEAVPPEPTPAPVPAPRPPPTAGVSGSVPWTKMSVGHLAGGTEAVDELAGVIAHLQQCLVTDRLLGKVDAEIASWLSLADKITAADHIDFEELSADIARATVNEQASEIETLSKRLEELQAKHSTEKGKQTEQAALAARLTEQLQTTQKKNETLLSEAQHHAEAVARLKQDHEATLETIKFERAAQAEAHQQALLRQLRVGKDEGAGHQKVASAEAASASQSISLSAERLALTEAAKDAEETVARQRVEMDSLKAKLVVAQQEAAAAAAASQPQPRHAPEPEPEPEPCRYPVVDQHKIAMEMCVRADELRLVSPSEERVISFRALRSWEAAGERIILSIGGTGGAEQLELVSTAADKIAEKIAEVTAAVASAPAATLMSPKPDPAAEQPAALERKVPDAGKSPDQTLICWS